MVVSGVDLSSSPKCWTCEVSNTPITPLLPSPSRTHCPSTEGRPNQTRSSTCTSLAWVWTCNSSQVSFALAVTLTTTCSSEWRCQVLVNLTTTCCGEWGCQVLVNLTTTCCGESSGKDENDLRLLYKPNSIIASHQNGLLSFLLYDLTFVVRLTKIYHPHSLLQVVVRLTKTWHPHSPQQVVVRLTITWHPHSLLQVIVRLTITWHPHSLLQVIVRLIKTWHPHSPQQVVVRLNRNTGLRVGAQSWF